MPCNSDYLEQDQLEAHIQKTVQLIKYVKKKLRFTVTKEENSLDTYYPDRSKADKVTKTLCELISYMSIDEMEEIVYNGRNKTSRLLADWWDVHQKADKKRADEVKRKKEESKIKKEALAKLNKLERKALGV